MLRISTTIQGRSRRTPTKDSVSERPLNGGVIRARKMLSSSIAALSVYLKENLSEPVCKRWPAARSGGVPCSQQDVRGDSTEAVGGRSHSVCWDGDAQIPCRRESSVPGRTGRSICDFRDL